LGRFAAGGIAAAAAGIGSADASQRRANPASTRLVINQLRAWRHGFAIDGSLVCRGLSGGLWVDARISPKALDASPNRRFLSRRCAKTSRDREILG
jgi:hypothetical protein